MRHYISMEMSQLIQTAVDRKASDLHILSGTPPVIRVEGELSPLENTQVLNGETCRALMLSLMNEKQQQLFEENLEIDFSFEHTDGTRLRVNAYHQKGRVSGALRLLSNEIKSIDDLRLPGVLHSITELRQGLVLVTGPTGSGKSTTLAAMIEEINKTRAEHIVTIEDPIEYVYESKHSIVSQRELHQDTRSWKNALRSVLREDPNIVLVGEMRDYETIAAALTTAETGHLVFATLHTNSAAQTIDRIIDVFPENQQPQVRNQLASAIEAVFAQRLIPSVTGERIPTLEIMLASSAVRNTIREGKTHQIDNIIQTSGAMGMMTFEASLAYWVKSGVISADIAKEYAIRPEELLRLIKQ